jgi:hypothetical protein
LDTIGDKLFGNTEESVAMDFSSAVSMLISPASTYLVVEVICFSISGTLAVAIDRPLFPCIFPSVSNIELTFSQFKHVLFAIGKQIEN